MTKMLEKRIARLESKMDRGDREQPPSILALIGDGKSVAACLAPPADVVPDLSTFYAHQEWRDRATCPDVATCEHAGYCEARGDIIKRMTKEELYTLGRLLDSHDIDDMDSIEQLPDDAKATVRTIINAAASRPDEPDDSQP